MLFADVQLARRVELAEAANARGCGALPGSSSMEIAGGCAIFAGVDSPLTQAVGIGLSGPVSLREIIALESFFRDRGSKVSIDLSPLANPDLLPLLAERGYRATQFNNVLVKQLGGSVPVPTTNVRRTQEHEADLWSETLGRGFFEVPDLTKEEIDIGRAIFCMPEAMCYLAVSDSGVPAGGASAAIRGGLMTLFADTTLPGYRRLGIHRSLITARLNDALVQGCDLATASTFPGSASQRNFERQGFEVVYTKVTLVS